MADWTTPDAIHSKCGEYPGKEAVLTIDDDTGTNWVHFLACYHWIIFDMGLTKKITQIRIYQYTLTTNRFGLDIGLYVYVSDNPADFGDPVWEGILDATGWQESGVFEKNGRYVKLVSKADSAYQRIYEFDAMAEAIGGVTYISVAGSVSGSGSLLRNKELKVSGSTSGLGSLLRGKSFTVQGLIDATGLALVNKPVFVHGLVDALGTIVAGPYVVPTVPPIPGGAVVGRYKNPCIIITVDGHVLLNINMKKPQYILID